MFTAIRYAYDTSLILSCSVSHCPKQDCTTYGDQERHGRHIKNNKTLTNPLVGL